MRGVFALAYHNIKEASNEVEWIENELNTTHSIRIIKKFFLWLKLNKSREKYKQARREFFRLFN